MSATLLTMSEEHTAPTAREQRLLAEVQETGRAFVAEVERYENTKQLLRLFNEYGYARDRTELYWERRTRKAERLLRDLLDTNLTAEQRANVLLALHVDRRRDRSLLSAYEQRLIAWYRSTDAAGAQMIRTLFDRLAATSPAVEGGA
jgi:hypothetical protein